MKFRAPRSPCLCQHIGTTIVQMKRAYQSLRCRIDRAQAEVRREHLPNHLWLEPHIRLCSAHLDVTACNFHFERLQHCKVGRERFLTEPSANLADRLKFLRVRVVAGEEERAVYVRPFALAVVPTYDDEVKRVSDASQVVLL